MQWRWILFAALAIAAVVVVVVMAVSSRYREASAVESQAKKEEAKLKTAKFGRYDVLIRSKGMEETRLKYLRMTEYVDTEFNVSTIYALDEQGVERAYYRYGRKFDRAVSVSTRLVQKPDQTTPKQFEQWEVIYQVDDKTATQIRCIHNDRLPEPLVHLVHVLYLPIDKIWEPQSFYGSRMGPSILIDYVNAISGSCIYSAPTDHTSDDVNESEMFECTVGGLNILVYVEPKFWFKVEKGDTLALAFERASTTPSEDNLQLSLRKISMKRKAEEFKYSLVDVEFEAIRFLNWPELDSGLGGASTSAGDIAGSWQSPLVLPRGFGCYTTFPDPEHIFSFPKDFKHLSAVFKQTRNASTQGSFVAISDGLIRFDTENMKRIYDIRSRTVYTIRAASSPQAFPDSSKLQKGVSCVQLSDSIDQRSPLSDGPFSLVRIFSVSQYQPAIFIGIEMFNGHMVELYESTLNRVLDQQGVDLSQCSKPRFVFLVPLVFANAQNLRPDKDNLRWLRVVYYVAAHTRKLLKMQLYGSYTKPTAQAQNDEGKFTEVTILKVIDEVIFTEFAYDLTSVQAPLDVGRSQLSGQSSAASLFALPECLTASADRVVVDMQLELALADASDASKLIDVKPTIGDDNEHRRQFEMSQFTRNKLDDIGSLLWQSLVESAGVPGMSVASFEVKPYHLKQTSGVTTSALLRLKASFAEMQQANLVVKSLGYFDSLDLDKQKLVAAIDTVPLAKRSTRADSITEAANIFWPTDGLLYVGYCLKDQMRSVLVPTKPLSQNDKPFGGLLELHDKCWAYELEDGNQNADGCELIEISVNTEKEFGFHLDQVEYSLGKYAHRKEARVGAIHYLLPKTRKDGASSKVDDNGYDQDDDTDDAAADRRVQFNVAIKSATVRRLHSKSREYSILDNWRLTSLNYITRRDDKPFHHNRENLAVLLPTDAASVELGFEFCRRLCQLEELCNSFSYCEMPNAEAGYERCILSTLALNRTQLEHVRGYDADGAKETELQVDTFRPASGADSAPTKDSTTTVVDLKRNKSCAVHAKEVLQLYELAKIYQSLPTKFDDGVELVSAAQFISGNIRDLSLDDCAGACQRHELDVQAPCRDFLYCAETRSCYYKQATASSSAESGTTEAPTPPATTTEPNDPSLVVCKMYTRDFAHLFARASSLKLLGLTRSLTGDDKPDLPDEKQAQIIKAAVAIRKPGLSFDQCAADCSLASTQCLAFDYCRVRPQEPVPLCDLYKIRSPLAPIDEFKFRLLDSERKFYEPGSELRNKFDVLPTPMCSHFYISDDYLDLKLRAVRSNWSLDKQREQAFLDFQQAKINYSQAIIHDMYNLPQSHPIVGCHCNCNQPLGKATCLRSWHLHLLCRLRLWQHSDCDGLYSRPCHQLEQFLL